MGKVVKYLIVQPHSDDALFSCAHPILGDNFEVQILTVENNVKRIKEDVALYDFLGIPFHHLSVEFDDESYYGYFKQYKGVNHLDAISYLENYFGEDKLEEIRRALLDFVKKFKKEHPDFQIIAPMGIAHPFHYFIHDVLLDKAELFYREFPHSYKKRSQPQMLQALTQFKLVREIPVKDIHDIKFELAKKFYKTQSGLLWFEQGYIKKELPEELYKKL